MSQPLRVPALVRRGREAVLREAMADFLDAYGFRELQVVLPRLSREVAKANPDRCHGWIV